MSTKRKQTGSVAIPLDLMWSMAFRSMSLEEIHTLIDQIAAAGRRTYVVNAGRHPQGEGLHRQ
jgi:hypothetical protein